MDKTVNFLIPEHRKLSSEEEKSILRMFSLEDKSKLPKIRSKDPALAELDVKIGNVIEITRKSFAGKSKYYRCVIE